MTFSQSARAVSTPWLPHKRCFVIQRSLRKKSRAQRWRSPHLSAFIRTTASLFIASMDQSRPRPIGEEPVTDLTPQDIVQELDRFIIAQEQAKRSLAVALRERERRKRLEPEVRAEIGSKNILMVGPTGVGKTELARRLAKLVDAPFLKTEATKFTEVGYVGRDVESIVRELADASVSMVHAEHSERVRGEAERLATERILNCLMDTGAEAETQVAAKRAYMKRRRRTLARRLAEHELEERVIEIEL